jgi:cytochrome c551/c552
MLRSIAELAACGTLAVLLTAASLTPDAGKAAGSATTNADAAANRPTALVHSAVAERGALLFATKGCIGCHVHAAFPNAHMQVGPELTGLPLRAATRVPGLDARAYVRQSLREPGAYGAPTTYTGMMPDLGLSEAEIEALTVFLLAPAP